MQRLTGLDTIPQIGVCQSVVLGVEELVQNRKSARRAFAPVRFIKEVNKRNCPRGFVHKCDANELVLLEIEPLPSECIRAIDKTSVVGAEIIFLKLPPSMSVHEALVSVYEFNVSRRDVYRVKFRADALVLAQHAALAGCGTEIWQKYS